MNKLVSEIKWIDENLFKWKKKEKLIDRIVIQTGDSSTSVVLRINIQRAKNIVIFDFGNKFEEKRETRERHYRKTYDYQKSIR